MQRKRESLTQEQVFVGASYFVYHLRMYIESLFWFQENPLHSNFISKITSIETMTENHNIKLFSDNNVLESIKTWEFLNNAILEVNLVHARVLIDFFCNENPQKADIVASDYFEKEKTLFPVVDEFLKGQAKKIGGRLVHLTRRAIPDMKSYQNWEMKKLAKNIIRLVHLFLDENHQSFFPEDIRKKCIALLHESDSGNIPDSASAST